MSREHNFVKRNYFTNLESKTFYISFLVFYYFQLSIQNFGSSWKPLIQETRIEYNAVIKKIKSYIFILLTILPKCYNGRILVEKVLLL